MMPSYNPYMWFPPQYRQAGGSAVILIVAIVVLLIADSLLKLGIVAGLKKLLGGKGGEEKEQDPDSAPVASTFSAKNEASGLRSLLLKYDFPGQGSPNQQAFKKILAYSKNELIVVHNAWLKDFKGQEYDTLRKAVDSEFAFNSTTIELKEKVLARLDKLSL